MKTIVEILVTIVIVIVYVLISIAIPVLIVAAGIWVYDELTTNDPEPARSTLNTYQTFDDTEVQHKSDYIGQNEEYLFIVNCTAEGATASDCKCVFDQLDDNLTNDEYRMLDNASEEVIYANPVFQQAISNCL